MESSTEAAEPFLIESKYIEDDVGEHWDTNPPPGRYNLLRLLYLVSSILVLVFTNTTTYFLFRPTNDYLDAHCASHASAWCKLAFGFVKEFILILGSACCWRYKPQIRNRVIQQHSLRQ